MKGKVFSFIFFFLPAISFGQKIISGTYNQGLKLSYDSIHNILSGYFENYTGPEDKTGSPQFSCIFYIEGKAAGGKFSINTYYPSDKPDDLIEGTAEIINDKTINLGLSKEHGGCWNVQHFADKPVEFELEKKESWLQIRYVDTDKTFFYKNKSIDSKLKSYLIKGNFVCVERIEGEWAFCTFFGKTTTKGWLKINDLNKL